jgi:glycosyltransferase involved in cell wall biosynthesis
MKIAIVHDWLVTNAGAEKVLQQMLQVYPEADVFCVVDHLTERNRFYLENHTVKTTAIQRLPFSKRKYQLYLPFMPLAIEQLDLKDYDIVLSSSHAVAKGVLTTAEQLHISYVHTPMRYAWDMQNEYLNKASGLKIKKALMRYMLFKLRQWDIQTANRVDFFVSNSNFIGKRIWRTYRRSSQTIYPPVNVEAFPLCEMKDDYYVTASRLVSYKNVKLLVEAFAEMPTRQLLVIGDGPEMKELKKIAPKNVVLLGHQIQEQLVFYMQRARAFLYAAEEDFGIALVEAQACGTPVIAYGKGGALETVQNLMESETPTGIFYYEQTTSSIKNAIQKFEKYKNSFLPEKIREHAMKFSEARFREELAELVEIAFHKHATGQQIFKEKIDMLEEKITI